MGIEAEAAGILRRLTGDPAARFHDGQLGAIVALVERRKRVLVVQRTGWGKSAVYFIATRLLRDRGSGPTILISPLLALMRNQVGMAARAGIRAETINSSNRDDWSGIQGAICDSAVDLLLISPERLNNPQFRDHVLPNLAKASGLLVVDEAHCVSDWGHDFRPDYRRIGRVLALLPRGVPVLCTTATANDRVVEDVLEQLGQRPSVIRGQLDRESLALSVLELGQPAERMAWLAREIPSMLGTGIVYCLTVRDTEGVARWLIHRGVRAMAYSGDSDVAYRQTVEDALLSNDVKVVVATSALGMGFDKPDLGFVVHYQSPASAIAYYGDGGWGSVVRQGKYHDHRYPEELVLASSHLIGSWLPDPAPTWVACVPSGTASRTLNDFVHRLADVLGLPFLEAVRRSRQTAPQKEMESSAQQLRNVYGAFVVVDAPLGPVLLVDDIVDSRWTLTVVGAELRRAGVPAVFPFVLAKAVSN